MKKVLFLLAIMLCSISCNKSENLLLDDTTLNSPQELKSRSAIDFTAEISPSGQLSVVLLTKREANFRVIFPDGYIYAGSLWASWPSFTLPVEQKGKYTITLTDNYGNSLSKDCYFNAGSQKYKDLYIYQRLFGTSGEVALDHCGRTVSEAYNRMDIMIESSKGDSFPIYLKTISWAPYNDRANYPLSPENSFEGYSRWGDSYYWKIDGYPSNRVSLVQNVDLRRPEWGNINFEEGYSQLIFSIKWERNYNSFNPQIIIRLYHE